MGSSRRAEGIPAFTRDVLGCFRSGVTPGVETLALRTSRRLATHARRDSERYLYKLLGSGAAVICAGEGDKGFRCIGDVDADDAVHQSGGPNVALDDESDREALNRRYACASLRS